MDKCECKGCAFNKDKICNVSHIRPCTPNDKNCPIYDFRLSNFLGNHPMTAIVIPVLTTLLFRLLLQILRWVL